jgi:hypothetical protein
VSARSPYASERDNPLLLWTHEGLDLEEVGLLEPRERATRLWDHTRRFLTQKSGFYRELLAQAGNPGLEELHRLPLCRPGPGWNGDRFLCEDSCSDTTYFTGGTSGLPKPFYSDLREDLFLNTFRAIELGRSPRPSYRTIEARVLNGHHGPYTPIPEILGHSVAALPVYSEEQFAHFGRFLTLYGAKNPDRKATSIRSQMYYLQSLTAFLMDRGFDASQTAVSLLVAGGWHITKRWRRKLESFWGARLSDIYGSTEFYQSYGRRCLDCDAYHYGWTIHVEVLDVKTGSPLSRGMGEIAYTHFVPFAMRQPLVRYCPGDLAVLDGICERTGMPRYLLGGRVKHAIPLRPEREPSGLDELLRATQIKDAVANLDFVRYCEDDNQPLYSDPTCWMPIFDWKVERNEGQRPRIVILVERRSMDSSYTADQRGAEEARLQQAVLAESPLLRQLFAHGELEVLAHIEPPGALNEGQWT